MTAHRARSQVRTLFSTAARKAQAAAGVAFLGPIGAYVATTGDWSWRYFAGSVIAGGVAGLTVFATENADDEEAAGV